MYVLTPKEAETFKVLFSKHNFVFKIAIWVIAVLCPSRRNMAYENIAEGNPMGVEKQFQLVMWPSYFKT